MSSTDPSKCITAVKACFPSANAAMSTSSFTSSTYFSCYAEFSFVKEASVSKQYIKIVPTETYVGSTAQKTKSTSSACTNALSSTSSWATCSSLACVSNTTCTSCSSSYTCNSATLKCEAPPVDGTGLLLMCCCCCVLPCVCVLLCIVLIVVIVKSGNKKTVVVM